MSDEEKINWIKQRLGPVYEHPGSFCPHDGTELVAVWREINYEFGTSNHPHYAILKVDEPVMVCAQCGFELYNWQSTVLREEAVREHREKMQTNPIQHRDDVESVVRKLLDEQ